VIEIEWAKEFAKEWIAAWNSHDLDRILSHYAVEIEFLSPFARKRTGKGRVIGIPAELKFDLRDVLIGHDCLTILYRNHRGQEVAETVEFGDGQKVIRSSACYG
jgi:hypothetical protein